MTLLATVKLLELIVFGVLAGISVMQWSRRRTAASAWLSSTFVVLEGVIVVARFLPEDGPRDAATEILVRALIVALIMFPYCLYRFGTAFSSPSRRREIVARGATMLLVVATLAVPDFPLRGQPAPSWYRAYTLSFMLDWTMLSLVAVCSLWRAGRGQPAVARHRMHTLGLAALTLNITLMMSVAGGSDPSPGLQLSIQLVGLASAVLFLMGFSPPRSLRTIWRRVEVDGLRQAEAALMVADTIDSVSAIVLPQAVQLLSARAAVVVDGSGEVISRHSMAAASAAALAAKLDVPVTPGTLPLVRPNLVAIPLRSGWLAVETSASAPFFGRDELVILETLGHLTGLAFDRAELVDRDRTARQVLAEREAQLAEAQRTAALGSYNWEIATGQVAWSDELFRVFGFAPAEVSDLRAAFRTRVHPDDLAKVAAASARAAENPDKSETEYRIVLPGGDVRWLHARVSPVLGADGKPVRLTGTIQDITERKATEEVMAFQALHDSLTHLPNRAMFLDRLSHALGRRSRRLNGLAVLFLDLDRFKWLNDSLGHPAGDELLVEVASRLQGAMRPGDTVARFGGDEFVVLCEELETEADAEALAARFARVLAEPMVVADEETRVTVSTGIAFAPPGSTDCSPETLLRDADAAMYQAKERGRNCHETFNVATRLMAIARHDTVNSLRLGIDRGELVVHYQPELDITTGRVVAVEALVRWQHPERGLLPPSEFISIAEDSGLIVELGRQVLDVACSQVMAWEARSDGGPPVALAVNLAARQLMAPDLCDVVKAALTRSGMAPGQLCLEITESVLLEDANRSARALEQLKALGVRIGVDDFGTGFSSLTYLKRFPVDTLKIDRSFVEGLGQDQEDRAIVASVVDLAHAFGLTTIAEGVETLEQLDELRTIGCEQGQGYLWSPPLSAEEAEGWIRARSQEPALLPPRRALGERRGPSAGQRILIVEDDPALRRLLCLIFEGEDGFEVVGEADDGREAIALARHFAPDIVLLDLAMPGMGGLEALPLLRAVAPSARVVVLSGLDSPELMETAKRKGAAAFYRKGGDPAELLDVLGLAATAAG
ncbi:MAG TPA: EAL domain-containing protein [Acidimicrobiales bacterium]|nr:EAL domain-containing protein [Acidimicrobiales bacterium]